MDTLYKSGDIFSRPENEKHIFNAWNQFHYQNKIDNCFIRNVISDSWKRCNENALVDRSIPRQIYTDTQELFFQNQELIKLAEPVMSLAGKILACSETIMVLADHNGTLLQQEGDTSIFNAAENVEFVIGTNWSEQSCGTNAVGTAIQIGKSVQIYGSEHYTSNIHQWSCSASLIRNPISKQVIGLIDVSGPKKSFSRHTLLMAEESTKWIENLILQQEQNYKFHLIEHCLEQSLIYHNDGYAIFDRHGHLIKHNDYATQYFNRLSQQYFDYPAQIQNLKIAKKHSLEQEALLRGISHDWIKPIFHNTEYIGALLIFPHKSSMVSNLPIVESKNVIRNTKIKQEFVSNNAFSQLIGGSNHFKRAIQKAQKVSVSPAPILLHGETGIGKDVFAQAIHKYSAATDSPFVVINCGALSKELLSSELFGYAEGAFTGAKRGGMIGKIEAANNGTLFLDEIGEMPLDLQPQLLRALENREIYRLGESKARKVNFRLITATNRDLKQQIQQGEFRSDLYYRIAVTSIHIPSLRERVNDIPLLTQHFIKTLSENYQLPPISIDQNILKTFKEYSWPGNIRELKNVVECLLIENAGEAISIKHLPVEFSTSTTEDSNDHFSMIEEAERTAIIEAIKQKNGNLTRAAQHLGIAKSTLYLKIDKLFLKQYVEKYRN